MRVTIKGLTPSTISFTTLGIVLRGNVEARSIDLKNDAQIREVNSICNAGLIEVIREESAIAPNPVIVPKTISKPAITPTIPVSTSEDDSIEDKPSKKQKGRPKGSKDKNPRKSKENVVYPAKKNAKPIKKLAPVSAIKPSTKPEDEMEGKVVVMTPGGAVSGNMIRSVTGDLPEGESTKASIQALKDMEAEEKAAREAEDVVEDQSKLDPSEQTGGNAVVSIGSGGASKVAMKNSILPQADVIKKAEKFIPIDQSEDKSADAFIDKDKDDDVHTEKTLGDDDDFLEV